MFPSRPHCPAHDDSLAAIINLCPSLNWTQGSNTNHRIIFQVLQQFVRRRKERIETVLSSTKTRRPRQRHGQATARHPHHPCHLWTGQFYYFLQIIFLIFFSPSVRRLDSGRWHLCLCLQGRASACLASHVLHLLLLPGQKNKYIFFSGKNTLSKICVLWDDLSRH